MTLTMYGILFLGADNVHYIANYNDRDRVWYVYRANVERANLIASYGVEVMSEIAFSIRRVTKAGNSAT